MDVETGKSFVFPPLHFPDTKIDPSLHERQRQLKKARLTDDLNDKLAHRPGPLELVQGNILQADDHLLEAIKGIFKTICRNHYSNKHLDGHVSNFFPKATGRL